MKRSPALQQLSREHHTALSLALRIAKAVDAAARKALMDRLPGLFAAELEPHFQEEEAGLLPQLAAAGEAALAERTLAEHAEMRAQVARVAAGEAEALADFGRLLQAHVRFEERELFAVAERKLPAFGAGTAIP